MIRIVHGDCLLVLPTLEAGSVDAVICDPPYPRIKRAYGYWTEAEWFALMNPVVEQCRRILKPAGSAVFILQPNSERLGRMRTWLWDFLAKWGREWGVVQDVYWWNYAAIPEAHSIQGRMTKPSVKTCVWLGKADCYRDQDSVLMDVSSYTMRHIGKAASRFRVNRPSGHGVTDAKCVESVMRRGGANPFNLLPVANSHGHKTTGGHGHGAGTPLPLLRWWTRFLCPPGGTVLDPFLGSGTTALACFHEGRECVGIEKDAGYVEIARKRLAEAEASEPLFAGAKG